MKEKLLAFGAGALFAVGLGLSGMTQPSKVVGFLDFTGAWDASLAFVMGVGLAVLFVAYRIVAARRKPWFAACFSPLPTLKIDARLVGGSALFGIGWGLSGFCPGPALVSFAALQGSALLFLPAMLLGMALFEGFEALRRRQGA